MIEATGDLWTYPADFRVITTNGYVRNDGCAVMGRGCAREAALKFPALPRELGKRLKSALGNKVHFFPLYDLFTFPVKHRWDQPADLKLIQRSTEEFGHQLLESAIYVMPRPGCGNGQRRWEDVRPLLVDLPDNVIVITFADRT